MNEGVYHIPIMCKRVVDFLAPERGGVFLDMTLGGGGHSSAILKRLPENGLLFGIDRDGEAIAEANERIARENPDKVKAFKAIRGNFFNAEQLIAENGVHKINGFIADLGVSSHQLDTPERGFSHRYTARLDMRQDLSSRLTAYDVVNGYAENDLFRIIRDYGEEKYAGSIARAIVKNREILPIETTTQLVDIIKGAMPAKALREKGHPASRTFQALRIEVNSELDGLDAAIRSSINLLEKNGIAAVITFHSLEDRIVKNVFRELQNPCTCDPHAPICTCGKKPEIEILTRKPETADDDEVSENPRARSAKLRVARKL